MLALACIFKHLDLISYGMSWLKTPSQFHNHDKLLQNHPFTTSEQISTALTLHVVLQTSPCTTIGRSTRTTQNTRNQAFWGMTPCRLVNSNWRFGSASCLHVHGSLKLY